jgi:hypothetical protein
VGKKEQCEEGVDFVEATRSGQAAEMGDRYSVLGFGLNGDREEEAAADSHGCECVEEVHSGRRCCRAKRFSCLRHCCIFGAQRKRNSKWISALVFGLREIGLLQCHF